MNKIKLDIQKFASVQTASYEGRYLKLTVTETETSIENNTSTITWLFESIGGSSPYYTIYNWSVKVAGQQIYEKTTTTWSTEKFPAKKGSKTGTLTIKHKADGTADPVSFTLTGKVYSNGTASFTGSLNLTTIPRASTPTIGAVTLGSPVTITTNRVSNTFTHTLRYQFGNATGTIATDVAETATWTPAITLAQQIPNAESGTGTIYCDTYSGTTLIGTKSVNFTASVPSSVVPSISLSAPTIGGSAPASWGIFVKGKSTASYTITGTGAQGSTIRQYQSSVSGYSYNTASVTTGILYSAGTQTISAKVIDSRGRQATTSKTFNVVDYYNPSFTAVQIQRVDQNGNLDDNGEYAYFHFAGSVSSCSGNNKGTFKIAYRIKNTGSYTEKTLATNQQSINQSGFITSDGTQSGTKIEFENTNTYDIKFMITDAFITVENKQELDTGFDLINWNPNGKAMAIGKVSEATGDDKLLEVALPIAISSDVTSTANISAVNLSGGWEGYTNDLSNTMSNPTEMLVLNGTNIQKAAIPSDNYNNLSNKPSINGVVLQGNKTSEDLGIDTPTTLFESATGTQSAITLSEPNTNYKSIEIIFRNNDNSYQSTGRLYNANGHTIYLISIGSGSSGKSWLKATEVKLNGNKITFSNNYSEITLENGKSVSITHTNTNYITRVVGYK